MDMIKAESVCKPIEEKQMIKKIFKANSWIDVFKHLLITGILFALILMVIFHIYLPIKTKKDNSITVPEVIGMEYESLDEFITSRELRYVVTEDSGYSANLPPQAVISQFPKPNAKVKEGRKIYLTLNAVNPPKVEMPDLVGKSLKTVELQFQGMGIKVGKYFFTPGPYKNTFVSAQIDGVDIAIGEKIAKGSVVDLMLQNGKGQQYFNAPDVIGKVKENAEFIITGSSLTIGEIYYQKSDSLLGRILRQEPGPGNRVRIGQSVDLWVGTRDSLATGNSLLDQNND